MLNIGPPELILIFVIALVIVGPQRLPELGRTIGKGLREFRKMQDDVKDLVNTGMGDDFKEATAELKKTAADLKGATDVRSAFRNDATTRTRPHGPKRQAPASDRATTPEPAADAPAVDPAAADAPESVVGSASPAEPSSSSRSDEDEPGSHE
ncbi:MAG: twin-arginine translocase TatA/TatE family subunit [Actinomycetota bacterium]|nr:twin-arginine translocase TatA/TatE family subunit [Actinomycetota bacterium]